MPHGFCINWSPWLLTLSVISNLLIFIAYFSIPIALVFFLRKREDLSFKAVLWLFSMFILACGSTHLMHVITYWHPWYWTQATLDLVTAVVSVATAIYLWPMIPKLLQLPSPEQLMLLNSALQKEIADRKLIEQALQEKSAALEKSNTDLERFAYSVSHDMRQPLRAISGHLQLLSMALKEKLDDEDRDNLDFALGGAKRMDGMILSLLEYSRVGRKTVAKELMESRQSLDEALSFLEPAIKEAGAKITIDGHWPRVHASRDELTRLFQNLIGNALHYHEPDQPPQIEVQSSVSADLWKVSIHDHGIGIDPGQIDRLFNFFSRLQARSRFEGHGMGLALCRRIVEHHSGRVWVESEGEGKGSTFLFEIPVHATSEEDHGE